MIVQVEKFMIFVINMYIFRLQLKTPPPKKNKYSKKMLTTKSLINLVPFKKSSAIQD